MNKMYPAAKTRDSATLEQQIMDPGIAKNDAEWWAMREIERLRRAMETAKNLIGAINDDAPHAVKASNTNQAWHLLNDNLRLTRGQS